MSYERNDFWDRERECERSFIEKGPFYFITTENLDWMLYESRDEFIVGTNLLAISAARSNFLIVDDIQMNSHHHIMGSGTYESAIAFAEQMHDLERKYQLSLGKPSLKKWEIRMDRVKDLKQFRNEVAYTDRNAYVARRDSMPTGYPWGSANLFFNGNLWLQKEGIAFPLISIREKRSICRSHNVNLPSHYRVEDGMILRRSFVQFGITENLFNSANQYFSLLTRRGEADIEMARLLGESIQIPSEEIFQILASWFPGTMLKDLSYAQRLQAAKMMKQRLASSNRQITQVLRLTPAEVERLFPVPADGAPSF